ncbi:hemopexin repeat-containing protein [Dactylosporangium siamense]|uniref:Hemopexin n=1 Tax=Dactylosporangium siamense TaxID=685454 RepID=A0A919PZQ6_9ACTN|nr:hypothetical protein Dsi01nite_095840 [Dactylosporangium siamense]
MPSDGALPSYQDLFGELLFQRGDESRSVYSPAAYLADLLQLVAGVDGGIAERRPDIARVPLDLAHTYTEVPYLDIVNEVLERALEATADTTAETILEGAHSPAALPFSLRHERIRTYLRHLGVEATDLYKLFADGIDPDTVAREHLGLTAADVTLLTTVLTNGPDLRGCFALGNEPWNRLESADRLRQAMQLSAADLRELLYQRTGAAESTAGSFIHQGGAVVRLDAAEERLRSGADRPVPVEWFERVNRFVRLARRTGLSFTDLDLVLRACCGNRIDLAALRVIAIVRHLERALRLPVDVVVSLVAPIPELGAGDDAEPADLFDRVFNVPFVAAEGTVLRGTGPAPSAYAGLRELVCVGDILASRNRDVRRRITTALSITEADLAAIVERFRAADDSGPFDRGLGPAGLALLHRVARLAGGLGLGVTDLLDVLDALDRDPAASRFAPFPLLIDPGVTLDRASSALAGTDPVAGLWLAQTLLGAVTWLRESGLTGRDLVTVLGGSRGDALTAVLERLRGGFDAVALTPAAFTAGQFGERAAEVLHSALAVTGGVLCDRDDRVVLTWTGAAAAYRAVNELGVIVPADLLGLGLDARTTERILTGLVAGGYVEADGTVVADRLPSTPEALRLSGGLGHVRDDVFALIAGLCEGSDGPMVYPSDLETLGTLTAAQRTELYGNLIYNGLLDPDGRVREPGFFGDPGNAAQLQVDAELDDVTQPVLALLREVVARFGTEPIPLDPAIFAGTGADERVLLDSLRHNGHIDADGTYADPLGLLDSSPAEFGLALELYPYRRQVLAAMQAQLRDARDRLLRLSPDDLRDIADVAVAQRFADGLDGFALVDGRPGPDGLAFFADPGNTLAVEGFTDSENDTVFDRIAAILAEQRAFRLDLAALTGLGFDDTRRDQLVAHLIGVGHLTPALTVPEDRLAHFATVTNAPAFTVPGLADFSMDVFFLLHAVAVRVLAGIEEITTVLADHGARQRALVFEVLRDALGVPAAVAEAICTAVLGAAAGVVELLVPDDDDEDVPLLRAFRRIEGFALLAARLGLDADEVALAFRDQQLTGKFAEPLALPPGIDRIDALLERADGTVLVFRDTAYWTYPAGAQAPADPAPAPLSALSAALTGLSVDAAFTDPAGAEWLVGRDPAGAGLTFVRQPGSGRWAARTQQWGAVTNAFAAPAAIDAAFVDRDGRTYLFCGDQYVRYTTSGAATVDDGYPRPIGQWWENEQHAAALPAPFRRSLDAAFLGHDGRTYLFAGDRFRTVGPGAGTDDPDEGRPVGAVWGRVRNAFEAAERVDAAYTNGSQHFLVAGDQVLRHTDDLENAGLRVDGGYPQRIETHRPATPPAFRHGLEASFVDASGTTHLFKDGQTVALGTDADYPGYQTETVPTRQRWGVLRPSLNPDGAVDAAFVGLDGHTYLFSGDTYLRYGGADYSAVDPGFPRAIAGDWGGLRRVGAAVVLDGATYLFGTGGKLFDAPAEHAAALDTGRLPRVLRQRLAEHAVTVAEDAKVTGARPAWSVEGVRLRLVEAGTDPETGAATAARIEAHFDPAKDTEVHVRYSTRDYTVPDPGYPRPLGDNWWNLPDEFVSGPGRLAGIDAVFTGHDRRTYLFSGGQYVVFDNKRRWWSPPMSLDEDWNSLPFDHVDAAFVGADGKTYVFADGRYVRYTDPRCTRVDERYPARVAAFWGNVPNNIARTGRVDAAFVAGEHTYLFSGDQYVRYTGRGYDTVDLGYPKLLTDLRHEPRLRHLAARLDGVDAAVADRRNVYLFRGAQCHVVSATTYRRYDDLPGPIGCAFVEDGALLAERPGGWSHLSALEGTSPTATPARPRALRGVPERFRAGLDAVLHGTDGTTYLFQGDACWNTGLNRAYPFAEEWGRARATIQRRVDAAFVGADGNTYVFGGEHFVTYTGTQYAGADAEGPARPVAEHWGGLRGVALAYVRAGTTYLFEPPGPDGTARCVTYSGADYSRPDERTPVTVDATFWDIPRQHRPAGTVLPAAVLFEGDTMLLVTGGVCLQRDERTGTWSYPRPLERIWRGLGDATGLTAAFTGRDGATYFFLDGEYARYAGGVVEPRQPIRDRWGRSRNAFLAAGARVDAAVVLRGVTYLFSGDQFVRYSGADYEYADAGYPKPIVGGLRLEEPFANLPATFDDELAGLGAGPLIDAVTGNDRTAYVFAGGACHAVSRTATATLDLRDLVRVRNTIAERQRVDAALVDGEVTYLFSGDQYVRYTGRDYGPVDDGYPRDLAGFGDELHVGALPEAFQDRVDAAFRDAGGRTVLFAGEQYLTIHGNQVTAAPIAGAWGVLGDAFAPGAPIDAAFVAPSGELYAFRGTRYIRYPDGVPGTVEPGYPRPVKDDWGFLPAAFERGIDGAFTLAGRVHLSRGDAFVKLPAGGLELTEHTVPQLFRHRFTDGADYRLADVRAISRFAALARAHPVEGGLAAFLLPGPSIYADPYLRLSTLFGWDADELRWCRRHSRFLSGAPADEDRFEIEFLLELAELFAFAGRLGTGPSALRAEVWARLHDSGTPAAPAALDAAGGALHGLLARRTPAAELPALARTVHDELNVARRDALVAAVIAADPDFHTARDLFDWFLIDVEMGGSGTTSRVREAIAAVQLYLHRYLLRLLPAAADDGTDDSADDVVDPEAVRALVKNRWSWMRGYRLWEANRKVFLYPENYLRPELRAARTPAFRALESDLLQGEITPDGVERAFKRYLDEYTEVSRLTIAGGYVYTKDMAPDGVRRLVLFGRTKTDPRRYYFRRAEFGTTEPLSATWEAWQPVNVQIGADQVHPVHAFGRVFVFWADAADAQPDDPGTTSVVVADDRQVSGSQTKTQRVAIRYSFSNLNRDWVPMQTLGVGPREEGTISGVTLLVRPRVKDDSGATSIAVSCSYTVTAPDTGAEPPTPRRAAVLFDLNPELYADDLLDPDDPKGLTPAGAAVMTDIEVTLAAAATAEQVSRIFLDRVDPAGIVRFDQPAGFEGLNWFSVDHKGGSFLCRPVPVTSSGGKRQALAGNRDHLPVQAPVDAAVELPNGVRYFFDNTARTFRTGTADAGPGDPASTGRRWGRRPTVLPGDALSDGVLTAGIDAVVVRGQQTFVLFGGRYVRFTGTPFRLFDDGYPRDLATNTDNLPKWTRVDVAFTGQDGAEYYYSRTLGKVTVVRPSTGTQSTVDLAEHWLRLLGLGDLEAVLVTDQATFFIGGKDYLRVAGAAYDKVDFKADIKARKLEGNPDGLPTDLKIHAAARIGQTTYYFDNTDAGRYLTVSGGSRQFRALVGPQSTVGDQGAVDAAWVGGTRLYLTRDGEYVRYTLPSADAPVPDLIDEGYPKPLPRKINAAFSRNGSVYLFSDAGYARINATTEPSRLPAPRTTAGAWADLPRAGDRPFDGALETAASIFLVDGTEYLRYSKSGKVAPPYERSAVPFELVRLTTGTASELNRRLLSGGVPALLDLATQELDEVRVSTRREPGAVAVEASIVDVDRLPTGSHLDFGSANGLYYWEIFFHAPVLIAQALNAAQRFEAAKQWWEYVFDPTQPAAWRFLPFLAADLDELADGVTADLADLGRRRGVAELREVLAPVVADLRALAPAALQNRPPLTAAETAALTRLTSALTQRDIELKLQGLPGNLPGPQRDAVTGIRERAAVIADLRQLFGRLGDREGLLKAYREHPFDPHAIADVRPIAYRRAVVMGYIDNLLDWADLLFGQYTPESVDEARMLYVLAYDLLGTGSELGPHRLPAAAGFAELDAAPGELDLAGYLTADGALLEGGGAVHAGVADGYFEIPGNAALAEYRGRVADRLRKIRQSMNILGISQPLPLFAPPLDPMVLVQGVAGGLDAEVVGSAVTASPPVYRFAAAFRKAQDLAEKLRQFGSQLLDTLDRRDAEELNLLRGRQEAAILGLTRGIKEAQVRVAEEQVAELSAGQAAARARVAHYEGLIAAGMSGLEQAQLDLMSTAASAHFASSVLKVAASIAAAVPQLKAGPFILGVESGGVQVSGALEKAAEVSESLGEGFSVAGEILGVKAQYERTAQDWVVQLQTAQNDIVQIGHQLAGVTTQLAIARQEAASLELEIAHQQAVAEFMRGKFATAELYGWMAAQLSRLHFEAYHLAHETALQAQRAMQFERGVPESEADFIRPAYWDSRRAGLLAGESLGLDLERLGKAYFDADTRGLEITKQVSLLELDPLALLRLRETGTCEFALTESEFDQDFPGHYRRQLRTLTVTFTNADGQPIWMNATLTQLGHKTVLEPDPQAVRHLLDPKGLAPQTVRADWRPSQQIALSEVDGDNNGLFELRYDDERYLPFERTGAVSTWRLRRSGRFAEHPYDVLITVRYTALDGGDVFTNAVRGMLRPYAAARFIDVAREFPAQWSAFIDGDSPELALPLTPQQFPGMGNRQIGAIYPTYEMVNGGSARLRLNGSHQLSLPAATLQETPGLTIDGAAPLRFVIEGDKGSLQNVGLVLTYQAQVQ